MSPRKRSDKKASRSKQAAGDVESAETREVSSVDEVAPSAEAEPEGHGEDVVDVAAQADAPAEVAHDAEPVAAAIDDESTTASEAQSSDQASAQAASPDDEAAQEEPGEPVAPPTTREHLKRVIESLVFVSDQVITPQQIGRIVKAKAAEVRELLEEIMRDYEGRGIELVEVSSGFQFRSAAASAPFVRDLVAQKPVRLTRAQLETLALVAYRQPITRPEIDDVRGVDSGSALKVLLERDLLKILGRKDEAGRPLLYGTTPHFLEFFGMKGMQDLPTLREFTDLTEENRELFKRKTGEIPDLSTEPAPEIKSDDATAETFDDEELMAIAQAAKEQGDDEERPVAEPSVAPEAADADDEPPTNAVEAAASDEDAD